MELYFEQQRFRQKWILLICSITPAVLLFPLMVSVLSSGSMPDSAKASFFIFLITAFVAIVIPILLRKVGLDTRVSREGLSFRFVPFHRHERVYSFEYILGVEAVQYSPVRDYGGWGIRVGRVGMAYNVYGNMGVMVTLKNGKSFLIGSQRSESLAEIITGKL